MAFPSGAIIYRKPLKIPWMSCAVTFLPGHPMHLQYGFRSLSLLRHVLSTRSLGLHDMSSQLKIGSPPTLRACTQPLSPDLRSTHSDVNVRSCAKPDGLECNKAQMQPEALQILLILQAQQPQHTLQILQILRTLRTLQTLQTLTLRTRRTPQTPQTIQTLQNPS